MRVSLQSHRNGLLILSLVIGLCLQNLFAAEPSGTKLNALYSWRVVPDGNYPNANLVRDNAGNLYGVTVEGGTHGYGTVFKLSVNASGRWVKKTLYDFCKVGTDCKDGASPAGPLVVDAAGNLYGTTSQGGIYGDTGGPAIGDGIVFKLSPTASGEWEETVLHNFGSGSDGVAPFGGVVFDKVGRLYGTTARGGTGGPNCFGGCGTVFQLTPLPNKEWTETVLYNFCSKADCADGNAPISGVVLDSIGNLYGTTEFGGYLQVEGVVFELARNKSGTWEESVLHTFVCGADGCQPNGIFLKGGVLYGTTQFGGIATNGANNGTVFKVALVKGKWSEEVIYNFCSQTSCSDGSQPLSTLSADKTGNLYSTTFSGGTKNWGTAFELTPHKGGTWSETVLHNFGQGTDGFNPHAGVVLDTTGNLYGVAYQGGTGGYGVAYEIVP